MYEYQTSACQCVQSSVSTTVGGTLALSDSLSYSKTGRISSYNDVSYTYDKLGRLTEAKRTAKDKETDEGSAEAVTAPAVLSFCIPGTLFLHIFSIVPAKTEL